MTGRDHPSQLTEADLIAYCTNGDPANNTAYQRAAYVRVFWHGPGAHAVKARGGMRVLHLTGRRTGGSPLIGYLEPEPPLVNQQEANVTQ